jgi:MFS family permease
VFSLSGAFRSLRNPNYRTWAVGALISNIGTWTQRTAQYWLVLTVLTRHSASAVGLVMSLQFGPQLLLLPWTGYAADHFNKRRMLMLTQAAQGVLAASLGLLTILGAVQLWQVYLFAALFGCVTAFDSPVRQVFVLELVGEADLANAVALNSMSFNAARMIGPAVAGVIIASVGTGWAFVVNGLSFTAVLVSLFLLKTRALQAGARGGGPAGGLLGGIRYVWSRPELMAIMTMLFLLGTFGLNFPIFISTMATKVFHTGARGFGLLNSVMAVGTIIGALLAAGRDRPRFVYLVIGAATFAVGCALAALAPTAWIFGALLVTIGVASLTFNNSTNSLTQLATEPSMRGRVMAIRMAIAMGCTPLGAPVVGWVADRFGPRWSLAVGAAGGLAAALVGLSYLTRHHHLRLRFERGRLRLDMDQEPLDEAPPR